MSKIPFLATIITRVAKILAEPGATHLFVLIGSTCVALALGCPMFFLPYTQLVTSARSIFKRLFRPFSVHLFVLICLVLLAMAVGCTLFFVLQPNTTATKTNLYQSAHIGQAGH